MSAASRPAYQRHVPESRQAARRPQVPAAYVSLYLPAGRRTWHWYSYRCRTCGLYQLGRARRIEDVAGARRASCGHQVNIVIARVYGDAR